MNAAAEALLHRAIAYHAVIAQATGSVTFAVLWGQIHYWTDKTKDPEGWVYKTAEDIFRETALTRRQLETAREIGEKMGVLEAALKGVPPIMHYRVSVDRMVRVIEIYQEKTKQAQPAAKQRAERPDGSIEWVRSITQKDMQEMAQELRLKHVDEVRKMAQEIVDYCESKGVRFKSYKATLRVWLRREIRKRPEMVHEEQRENELQKTLQDSQSEETPEKRQHRIAKLDEVRRQIEDRKKVLGSKMAM